MTIKEMIEKHEGRRYWAYLDTKLIWTTGIGFNLERAGAKEACAKAGVNYDMIWAAIEECKKAGGGRKVGDHTGPLISDAQMDTLYDNDVAATLLDAKKLQPGFDTWPDTAKAVLVDLIYNVGAPKLGGWKNTMGAFKAKNWKGVAANLAVTQPWRGQVGKRADELIALMQAL